MDFTKNQWIRVHCSTLLSVLAVLGASGCSGASGEADAADIAESAEAFTRTSTLPWRGAPRKDVNVPHFGGDFGVYAVDIGMSSGFCFRCPVKAVTSLRYWYVTSTSRTTPQSTTIGTGSAQSWTQQVCPLNQFASGYAIGVGTNTGSTRIERFGLICTEQTRNQGTSLPILGNSTGILFPERLNCSGQFTTDPVRFMGQMYMNARGDGMQADCVRF